nr:MAG TPA: hypothetical protein [Caudoviricetes sp.]
MAQIPFILRLITIHFVCTLLLLLSYHDSFIF